jgi:membrane-bound lytic murein transglycosylase D
MIAKNPHKYDLAASIAPVVNNEEEDREVIAQLQSSKDDLQGEPGVVIEMEEVKGKPGHKNVAAMSEAEKVRREIAAAAGEELPPPQKQETASYMLYKVKRRDTLYAIAKKYGVKVKNLKKWNKLRYNRIYPGQKLRVYGQGPGPEPVKIVSTVRIQPESRGSKLIYTVNYTDSLARIALFFSNVSARDIMRWNGLRRTRIHPKQKLTLYLSNSPRKVVTHVVKRGETTNQIAVKYGVRLEYVLSLNGLLTDTRLKPGKKLKIYYF